MKPAEYLDAYETHDDIRVLYKLDDRSDALIYRGYVFIDTSHEMLRIHYDETLEYLQEHGMGTKELVGIIATDTMTEFVETEHHGFSTYAGATFALKYLTEVNRDDPVMIQTIVDYEASQEALYYCISFGAQQTFRDVIIKNGSDIDLVTYCHLVENDTQVQEALILRARENNSTKSLLTYILVSGENPSMHNAILEMGDNYDAEMYLTITDARDPEMHELANEDVSFAYDLDASGMAHLDSKISAIWLLVILNIMLGIATGLALMYWK